MTDDERDELATAYLDGECTAEERRQVDSDPGLRARVAELAAIRAAVAGPVAASPAEQREKIIASALAEYGRIHAEAPASLTAARHAPRRRPVWTRLAPLGAVAVLLVAVIGLAAVLRDSGSSDEAGDATAASGATEQSATELASEPPVETTLEVDADEMADAARDEASILAESSAEAGPVTEAAGGGETADTIDAASATTAAASETTAVAQTSAGDGVLDHVCDPAVREIDPELGELVEVTAADDGSGGDVLVYVLTADPGARRSYQVDPPACADIVRQADGAP
jgi:hypothetical protein